MVAICWGFPFRNVFTVLHHVSVVFILIEIEKKEIDRHVRLLKKNMYRKLQLVRRLRPIDNNNKNEDNNNKNIMKNVSMVMLWFFCFFF